MNWIASLIVIAILAVMVILIKFVYRKIGG